MTGQSTRVPLWEAMQSPIPEGEGPRCPECGGLAARGHQTWCPEQPKPARRNGG